MTASMLRALRFPILALVVVLTAWLGSFAATVGIEQDNRSLNTRDEADLLLQQRFRDSFGSDEELLVALAHPSLPGAEGLALVDELTRTMEATAGVRRVWSLANVEELVVGEFGPEPQPLLPPPWTNDAIRAALDRNPDLVGWLVSKDGRTAGFVVELDEAPDEFETIAAVIATLRSLGRDVADRGGELHLAGVPVQAHDVAHFVDRDRRVLMPLAVVLLGVVLAWFFRVAAAVLVPLAVAGMSVVWTLGLYAATGHELNAITSLLPPVLLVVSIASTVHVCNAWLRSLPSEGTDAVAGGVAAARVLRSTRAFAAARAVFLPALLCALTTAQGFASLALGGLAAVQQFGLFAAFGTLVAFVGALGVAPLLLGFVAAPSRAAAGPHPALGRLLEASARLSTTRPVAVLSGFAAVSLLLAAGIPLVRSNTDLVGFLKPDAALVRDSAWIDAQLGGTLPIDFLVERRDGLPLDSPADLRGLAELEKAMLARDAVGSVTSVVTLLRQVARVADAQAAATDSGLPEDDDALVEALDLLDESGHPLVRRLVAPGLDQMRMSLRLHAVGSAVSLPLVEAVQEDAARLLGDAVLVQPTGALWYVVRDSERLVRRQMQSLALAFVLVVATIGFIFRSWRLTLVAMVPNVLPVLWVAGLMGWTGVELSSGTAMIGSAVLGLVVDDTIHYLSHYRRLRRGEGPGGAGEASSPRPALPVAQAARATTAAVGAPVTVSSVALVLGFWVGAFGSFQPTVEFSLLTGLAMIVGVFCDLLVLPAALVLLDE